MGAEGAGVHDGGGLAALVVGGGEGFGGDDVADGVLGGPVGVGDPGEAGGDAIRGEAVGGGLEVPAGLSGFGSVEAGDFETEGALGEAGGEDVEGYMGGVLLVVAEGGDGVLGGGGAVGVGGGAEGGVADGGEVEAEEGCFGEAEVVQGGELHDEVVGVLAVDDGVASGGFALLKELGIEAVRDGGGLEREHGAEGEEAVTELVLGHGHDPVGGKDSVMAAIVCGLLLGVGEEGVAVEHEGPASIAAFAHEHGHRGGRRLDGGAGGGVLELRGDEGGGLGHGHGGWAFGLGFRLGGWGGGLCGHVHAGHGLAAGERRAEQGEGYRQEGGARHEDPRGRRWDMRNEGARVRLPDVRTSGKRSDAKDGMKWRRRACCSQDLRAGHEDDPLARRQYLGCRHRCSGLDNGGADGRLRMDGAADRGGFKARLSAARLAIGSRHGERGLLRGRGLNREGAGERGEDQGEQRHQRGTGSQLRVGVDIHIISINGSLGGCGHDGAVRSGRSVWNAAKCANS